MSSLHGQFANIERHYRETSDGARTGPAQTGVENALEALRTCFATIDAGPADPAQAAAELDAHCRLLHRELMAAKRADGIGHRDGDREALLNAARHRWEADARLEAEIVVLAEEARAVARKLRG